MNRIINTLISEKKRDTETLVSNYKKALKQKYNAVCFEIDGTLTTGITEIDDNTLESFYSLIKRRVPIVFVTGRGITGTKEFVRKLIEQLQLKYRIGQDKFSRFFSIVNDGTMLLSSNGENETLFEKETIMVSNDELEKLKQIDFQLNNIIDGNRKKTYSYSSNGDLLNIRLIFDLSERDALITILNQINHFIDKIGLSSLNITNGIWNNYCVLQIGLSNKGNAIKTVEKIIGIPENSMLRIGDCGDIYGNDYEMLNCLQGFSVREISDSITGCFPVIDNTGKVLKGAEATNYLINNMNILPTISLEKAYEPTYRKQYADVERKINLGKTELLKNMINCLMKILNKMVDLMEFLRKT